MEDIYTHKEFQTKDGIPILSNDIYWGKATAEEFEKAINFLEKQGWDEFKHVYDGKFDFTFEENRADWMFNIPVNKDFVVLDTGAGMGRISIPLARVVKKVIAFDSSFLRMKFLKKRAQKEGLNNIDVLVADFFALPFKEKSFDLIVMNGVLEWVSTSAQFQNPRDAQIAALKICKNLLKQDGYLYVGIENRFALAYLKGVDHGGLRFTSYMPRWIANIYTKARKGHKYNTYIYSKKGYEKLFNEAGFYNQDFYLVYPGYNLPRIIIPYHNLNILGYVIRAMMPSVGWKRVLAKKLSPIKPILWVYRQFFFSFNIIAKNDKTFQRNN